MQSLRLFGDAVQQIVASPVRPDEHSGCGRAPRYTVLCRPRLASGVPVQGELRLKAEFRQQPLGKDPYGMPLPRVPGKDQVVPHSKGQRHRLEWYFGKLARLRS